jgi:hypothetical protein
MKLSQLKQIIKEEINELGFDYPGKPADTPSPYQNGIMDALKAMQQLGVNIDVQAVMDIIYPDDENPINEATAKVKNLVLKSDNHGVSIKRKDPNDGGRVNSEIYISKIELPDVINFLNGAQ